MCYYLINQTIGIYCRACYLLLMALFYNNGANENRFTASTDTRSAYFKSAIMLSMAYIRVSSVLSAHLYLFVDKKTDIHYSIQHVTVELDTQDTFVYCADNGSGPHMSKAVMITDKQKGYMYFML